MPRRKPVDTLTKATVLFLSTFTHNNAKMCARMKRQRNVSPVKRMVAFEKCCEYFVEVCCCVPAPLYEEFVLQLQALITEEKSMLDESYYEAIGALLNSSIKNLVLDKPCMFQDSSLALEAFLKHLHRASKLREVSLAKSVVDLVDFEFDPVLFTIATFQSIKRLSLPGLKQIDVETETMHEFLHLLQNNCCEIKYLDLSESSVDNSCCEVLADMSSLSVLKLNHCPKLESVGVAHLLRNLDCLTRLDAIRGRQSNVQNAMDIVCKEDNNNQEGQKKKFDHLLHMTFRDAHGIPTVAPHCPAVNSVKVIYNVFEYGYDASIDKCLVHLQLFPEYAKSSLSLDVDLNCLNMLFVIQMRNLPVWGRCLKKLCLTESEFVHPQTLNPFALQCPNLAQLVIVNPTTISDDLFVGLVPQLAEKPFENLTHFSYEGEKFPVQLGNFLLSHCIMHLQDLFIAVEHMTRDIFHLLDLFIDLPRPKLKKACFYFGQVSQMYPSYILDAEEEDVERNSETVASMFGKFIENSENLEHLQVFVRQGNVELHEHMSELHRMKGRHNWNIDLRIQVKHKKGH